MSRALLLDEHYAPRLALELRERGHDVVALLDLPGGPALADPEVFALAAQAGRRVVTENVRDFRPLLVAALESGRPVAPLLLVPARRFPRDRARSTVLVEALLLWLTGEGDHRPLEDWLTPTPS